jgi:hypothetical protein
MNLTIHFSPVYDKGCYLNDPEPGKTTFGEKYIGASSHLASTLLKSPTPAFAPKATLTELTELTELRLPGRDL